VRRVVHGVLFVALAARVAVLGYRIVNCWLPLLPVP
jgi:hypothetical protein